MSIQLQTVFEDLSRHAGMVALAGFLIGFGSLAPGTIRGDDSPRVRLNASDSLEESADTEEPVRPRKVVATKVISDVEETTEAAESPERVIGNGFGTMGRLSHLGGRTFGRNASITPLEYMPYLLLDEHFIFADARGFVTNRSQVGGNLGVGYRRLFDDWNAWSGASVWYDADQSTSKMFQQVGLSFEGLIRQFEVRSNVYLPLTSNQAYSNSIGNAAFVGNQLLYTRSIEVGAALRGVDVEVGYSLPVQERHVVRGFIGGYHFDGGSTGGVNGFKARLEAVVNNTATAQVLYTNDKLYGSNLMVGLSMQFPFGSDHPTTGWFRNTPSPFRFVERNYNVIVDQSQTDAVNQVAADPTTGQAYRVEQVFAPAAGGLAGTPDGTTAHPFSTVAAAQAAGGNVIFVQSGSVLNEAITLTTGQRLFGQGDFQEMLATTGGGLIRIPNLPHAVGSATPLIQNVTGTAVTLASNTEVAGFNITGSTGNGIAATNVAGLSLHDLTFASIGGDAINLSHASGSVTIRNTQVNSATGNGIVFDGGAPNITYLGSGNSITAQGNGFVLENLTGGVINISELSLNNTGKAGLVVINVATDATFGFLTISNSGSGDPTAAAVAISGNTAQTKTVNGVSKTVDNTYTFAGTTNITGPHGPGFFASGTDAIINVANLNVISSSSGAAVSLANATSPITFDNLTVNTQNATGLLASAVTNLQVNAGSFKTVNAPAIDVTSSTFNASLSSVSVDGGPYGVKLAASTGIFTIAGAGTFASGGTIKNTTTAGLLINSFTNTNLGWVDFVNNATAIQSTGSTQISLGDLRINGSTGYAIDSLNDGTLTLQNSILGTNGSSGGGTIREQAGVNGQFVSNILSNTITDSNGTAIQYLTQPGGALATLTAQVFGNTVSGSHSGSSIIGSNWAGPVVANINTNTLNAYGSGMTAILLQDSSTTAVLNATVDSNIITFQAAAATSGTGIQVIDGQSGQTSTGSSVLTLNTNTIKFQGTGGTGMRFALFQPGVVGISGNLITDLAGGATGMLFDAVAANSVPTIATNTITLLAGDSMLHRGIIFAQVSPMINLNLPAGTAAALNNAVYNCTSPQDAFSIPVGKATGGLVINEVFVPAP